MSHARDDAAAVRIEAAFEVVTDVRDDVAGDSRHIDARVGDRVHRQEDETGRDGPFGRDLGGGVLEEKGVHDRVRKLVADLVGVTAGHGLRREDRSSSHGDLLEPVR